MSLERAFMSAFIGQVAAAYDRVVLHVTAYESS